MIDFDTLLNGPVMDTFARDERLPYERPGEMAFDIRAIYDKKHITIEFSNGAAVSAHEATMSVRLSEFPVGFVPQQGDRVQVLGQTRTVIDVRDDAEGMAVLVLSARAELF